MARMKEIIATASGTHNVLASGTQMTGDISAEEDFRIDGNINGNIVCKGKIVVGNNSIITGSVECSHIEIWGEVKGNILCTENVILRATSLLTGDIKTGSIEIEPGAKFQGKCSMYDGH